MSPIHEENLRAGCHDDKDRPVMETSDMYAGEEMDGTHAHSHGDTHMFAHNRKLSVKSVL